MTRSLTTRQRWKYASAYVVGATCAAASPSTLSYWLGVIAGASIGAAEAMLNDARGWHYFRTPQGDQVRIKGGTGTMPDGWTQSTRQDWQNRSTHA